MHLLIFYFEFRLPVHWISNNLDNKRDEHILLFPRYFPCSYVHHSLDMDWNIHGNGPVNLVHKSHCNPFLKTNCSISHQLKINLRKTTGLRLYITGLILGAAKMCHWKQKQFICLFAASRWFQSFKIYKRIIRMVRGLHLL